MRLNRKILLITIGTLLVTLLISSVVSVLSFRRTYTDALLKGAFGIGHSVNSVLKEALSLGLPLHALSGMNGKLQEVVALNSHIAYVGVGSMDAVALYHSNPLLIGKQFSGVAMERGLAAMEPFWQVYDRFDGERYFNISIPIFSTDKVKLGTVNLGFPSSVVDDKVWKSVLHTSVNVLITFFFIALLLNYFLVRHITRPISRLSDYAEQITQGRFDTLVTLEAPGEVGDLSRSLNRMALTLSDQFSQLETARSDLKAQVKARTHELAEANDALQKRNRELLTSIGRQKVLTQEARSSREALQRNEERFRTILESTSVGVFGIDRQGRHSFVNPAAARMMGADVDALLGRKGSETWCAQGRSAAESGESDACPVLAVLEHGAALSGEELITTLAGKPLFVEFHATPILEEDEITGVVVTFSDISDRRRTERLTRGIIQGTSSVIGEDFLRELVRNLALSLDMRYALVGRMIGARSDAVRVISIWAGDDFAPLFDYDLAATPCEKVVGKELCAFPDRIQERFPEDKILVDIGAESYVGAPLIDSEGKPLGILAVLDVKPLDDLQLTESILEIFAGRAAAELERQVIDERLVTAKERAEASYRTKSEFLAMMSHEIRTPMNAILGMTDLLGEPLSEEEQQSYLEVQRRAGAALLTLIDDILELSRLEAGVDQTENRPFKMHQLLFSVASFLDQSAKEKGIWIDVEVEDDLAGLWLGDERRIRQVLLNLVGNAVKFTHEGVVRIQVTRGEGAQGVCIAISDTGIGIPEAFHDKIFESFQQVDSTTTRKHGGSGLGLAITRRLMTMMQGTIAVESQPEQGTRFSLTLPLERAVAEQEEVDVGNKEKRSETDGTVPLRILLAEDSPDNSLLIRAYLKRTPHHLEVVENGAEAVKALEKGVFDCVLMDMQMPVMDGYHATRAIREREANIGTSPGIAIIALTAHALEGDRERCLDAGCDHFLSKPVSRDGVLEVLDKHILPRLML
ncbi:MAG: response regulator [Magnetococcales bacterium]|nr:response regulator [Magnetococcales bacterium]